jgi:hypothetical protein
MATSKTSIANKALGHLGQDPIIDLDTDVSVRGDAIREVYEETIDEVLRDFDWKFAIFRKDLNADSSYTAADYSYRYILPTNPALLKFLNIVDAPREKYALEGGYLYSNLSTVRLRYVGRVTDPTKFDATFVETLALKLAGVRGYKITGNQGLADNYLAKYEKTKLEAQSNDSQEKTQTYQDDSLWEETRNMGPSSFIGDYV